MRSRCSKVLDTQVFDRRPSVQSHHTQALARTLHESNGIQLVRAGRLMKPTLPPPLGSGHAPHSGMTWAASSGLPHPTCTAPAMGSQHGSAAVNAHEELGRSARPSQGMTASGPAETWLGAPQALGQEEAHLLAHADTQPPAEADAVCRAQA